jgi:hypothetical protein
MVRAALSVAALSAWLVLLFSGWVAGGAVHALLVAAVVLFPWRAAASPGGDEGATPTTPASEDERS